MKKILSLFLAGMLVSMAAGCGANSGNSSTTGTSGSTETAAKSTASKITLTQTDINDENKRTITISYPADEVDATLDENDPSYATLTNADKDYELSFELLIGYGYSSYKESMSEENGFIEHKVGKYDAFSFDQGSMYETNIVFEEDEDFDAYVTVYTAEADYDGDIAPADIFNSKEVQDILTSIEYGK